MSSKNCRVTLLKGENISPHIDDVASLRIRVFKEFPYLYDGDLEYEKRYLAALADSSNSVIVLVQDGEAVVGASTGMPLADAEELFQKPFSKPERYFYFAESVLLCEYRGLGLGHKFFDLRESVAGELGFERVCFCAVVRPAGHPAKPDDYRALEPFWRKRGFSPVPSSLIYYPWKEIGESQESEKPMQFWDKKL